MKYIYLFFILLIIFSINLFAQDERFFRKIFSGRLSGKDIYTKDYNYKWIQKSSVYKIDLNNDGIEEGVVTYKKDGDDWISIYNATNRLMSSYRLDTRGKNSYIFKLSFRKLSSETNVLIIFFYSGNIKYLNFSGATRIYFLTVDKGSFKSLHLEKGPIVWQEVELFRQRNYFQREFDTNLFDYNNDGIKEIAVKYGTLARVYMYIPYGKWVKI